MTAVLERAAIIGADTDFHTEPYELPWAAEARFFVQTFDLSGDLEVATQVSPDGLTWCDLEDTGFTVNSVGLTTWLVTGFGQWLRLRCRVLPADRRATVRIYLVGKS